MYGISIKELSSLLNLSPQSIHQKIKINKLETTRRNNKILLTHKNVRDLFNFSFNKKIISFQIVKGGTGKTTLAHAIAIQASLLGAKILCVDLDQQANLSQAFNVNAEELPIMVDLIKNDILFQEGIVPIDEGIDLIPSRIENAVLDNVLMLNKLPLDKVFFNTLVPLQDKYDFIIIDCPPTLGQSVVAAALVSSKIISPISPEHFSISGIKITKDEINRISKAYSKEIKFYIALNKFDMRTLLSHNTLAFLNENQIFNQHLLNNYIRQTQEFPNSIAENKSIFHFESKSRIAKEDIRNLALEIIDFSYNNRSGE